MGRQDVGVLLCAFYCIGTQKARACGPGLAVVGSA